ncbi:hypothetical protein ZOSMA_90G00230 [Zostera marina]|uniref:Uncharacterized protein n=1 Tax=Zostera marina TaxID=29655 RepID=A0A0K9NJQ7_ZOSMR|nr:hypothetical protein ZOSMA_90G00230 [Zostera marina]
MVRKNVASLLNSIETSLRSNHDALETISENINSYGKVERETNLKQILDIETVIGFCIQVGHALTFRCLLVESAKAILEEKAPLFVSLLSGVVKQLSDEISEKDEIKRLRTVANDIGVIEDHDTECIYSTMSKVGLSDSSWSPFPCLCAAFIASNIWNTASYDVNISGFNDNIHCLARCISSVIAGSELAILERNEQERRSLPKDHVDWKRRFPPDPGRP